MRSRARLRFLISSLSLQLEKHFRICSSSSHDLLFSCSSMMLDVVRSSMLISKMYYAFLMQSIHRSRTERYSLPALGRTAFEDIILLIFLQALYHVLYHHKYYWGRSGQQLHTNHDNIVHQSKGKRSLLMLLRKTDKVPNSDLLPTDYSTFTTFLNKHGIDYLNSVSED